MATTSPAPVHPPLLAVTPTPGEQEGEPSPAQTPKHWHSAHSLRDMPPTASSLSERIALLQRANQKSTPSKPAALAVQSFQPSPQALPQALAPPSPGPEPDPLPRPHSAMGRFETLPPAPLSPSFRGPPPSPGSLKDRIARFQASAVSEPVPRLAWTSATNTYHPPPRARRFEIDPSARPLVPHITGGLVHPQSEAWVSPLRASRTGVSSNTTGPLWGGLSPPQTAANGVPMLRGAGPDAFQELDRPRTPSGSSSVANDSCSSAPGNESAPSVIVSCEDDRAQRTLSPPASAQTLPLPQTAWQSPSLPSSPTTPSGSAPALPETKSARVAAAEAEIALARRRGTAIGPSTGHGILQDLQERTGVRVDGTGRGGEGEEGVVPPRRTGVTGRVLSITQDKVADHLVALERARRRKDQRQEQQEQRRSELQARRSVTTGSLESEGVPSPIPSPSTPNLRPLSPVSTNTEQGTLSPGPSFPVQSASEPHQGVGTQASTQSPPQAPAAPSRPVRKRPVSRPQTPPTLPPPSATDPAKASTAPTTSPPCDGEANLALSPQGEQKLPLASPPPIRPSPQRIRRPPPGAVLSLVDMDASDDEYEPGWVQVVSRG